MESHVSIVRVDTESQRSQVRLLWDTVFVKELRYVESVLEDSAIVRQANVQGRTFLAIDSHGHPIGCISGDWWKGLDVCHPDIAKLELWRFSSMGTSAAVATARRWVVLPSYRKSGVAEALAHSVFLFAADTKEIRFLAIDSGPGMVERYRRLGFRQYAAAFQYATGDFSVPMCLVLNDHQYLRDKGALFLPSLVNCGFRDDPESRDNWHVATGGHF